MNQIRIWSLARALGVTCKDVLIVCAQLGIKATCNFSTIAVNQAPLIAKKIKAHYPAARSFARAAILVAWSVLVTVAVWAWLTFKEQWPVAKYHLREGWKWLHPKLLALATDVGDRLRVKRAQLGLALRDGSQQVQMRCQHALRRYTPQLVLSVQLMAMQPVMPVSELPQLPSHYHDWMLECASTAMPAS